MADELDEIQTGNALMAETPGTFEPAKLSGPGIPVHDGSIVQMRDGSSAQPIQLPGLNEKVATTAFAFLMAMTGGKVMQALAANATADKLYLTSRNGRIKFEEIDPSSCFNAEDICECPPDWVAGFKEIEGRMCLVKFTAGGASDFWDDTTSIDISGAGVDGNPFQADVKISEDAGNLLTVNEDGLFVGAP